jgi:hypothetical protein
MNLMGVIQYLEQRKLGRIGESLFATEMPLECKEGVVLLNTYTGTSINHYLPGWRDTGFRMVARSYNYEQGHALAEKVARALTIQQEVTMGKRDHQMLVKMMLPVNDPLPYRRSEGGYWEFQVDVECAYVKQS